MECIAFVFNINGCAFDNTAIHQASSFKIKEFIAFNWI